MGLKERLHIAQNARNLTSSAHQTTHIDLVAASGIAERHSRIGALAFRTLEDERFAPKLFELASKAIIGKARSQHWRIRKREDLEVFTIAVGRYWLKPYCRHCEGRGVQVEGQIAKDICPVCAGTGRRELPTPAEAGMADLIDERRFQKYVREALLCLDAHITGYLGKTRSALG